MADGSTATEIVRFRNKEPGRGSILSGVFNILLTGYEKGTGITLDATKFGIGKVMNVVITPVDCDGLFWFDLDVATWTLTINDPADGLEIESDGADASNIRVMFWGF